MSRGNGSSLIPVAAFLAILLIALLLIALPVSAANVTTPATTVATSPATVAPTATTVATTNATTVATPATTAATTATTAAPPATTVTTQPVTVVPTTIPATTTRVAITTGSVNVYSSPTGATILIDGIYSGTTPTTVNVVPAGNHILRLALSGYYDYEGSIYVVPGEMAQGYGTLQPMNPVTSAAPAPVLTATIPAIVTIVTATPEPTQDPGLLGNTSVIVAIIGAITVLIVAGVSLFIHLTPPKNE